MTIVKIDKPNTDKKSLKKSGVSRRMVSYYKKQEGFLRQQPKENLRSKNYFLQNESDTRVVGKFPEQQKKLAEHIRKRRGFGKAVSTPYIRRKMKIICIQDNPPGFDIEKDKFQQHWVTKFMNRHGFSVRRVTNKKKKVVWERLHKIHNYHWYTQYQMRLEDISDISSGSEDDECLDAKSDGADSEDDEESSSEETTS